MPAPPPVCRVCMPARISASQKERWCARLAAFDSVCRSPVERCRLLRGGDKAELVRPECEACLRCEPVSVADLRPEPFVHVKDARGPSEDVCAPLL